MKEYYGTTGGDFPSFKIQDAIEAMDRMRAVARSSAKTIYCHPDNVPYLEAVMRRIDRQRRSIDTAIFGDDERYVYRDPLEGLDIRTSEHMPREIRDASHWTPPRGDRFVEYGREDHDWMQPLGRGEYELVFYGINDQMLSIPTLDNSPLLYVRS